MTDKPISFRPNMIRAILEGRKNMTRRVLKPVFGKTCPIQNLKEHGERRQHYSGLFNDPSSWGYPFAEEGADMQLSHWPETWGYTVGKRLLVKEPYRFPIEYDKTPPSRVPKGTPIHYEADCEVDPGLEWGRYRHAKFIPKCFSRLTLIVESLKVERLQDIAEEDAMREGAEPFLLPPDGGSSPYKEGFQRLWNDIHGEGAYEANPWVTAIGFRVIRGNIDEMHDAGN